MTSLLTTLDRPAASASKVSLLSQQGYVCELLRLDASSEFSLSDPAAAEQVLYVLEGEVTVASDAVNTLLDSERAFLVPAGRAATLTARNGLPARVLRVEVPPRQLVTAPITTLVN